MERCFPFKCGSRSSDGSWWSFGVRFSFHQRRVFLKPPWHFSPFHHFSVFKDNEPIWGLTCKPDIISIVFETTKLTPSQHSWFCYASSTAPDNFLSIACELCPAKWIMVSIRIVDLPTRSSGTLQLFVWFCTWSTGTQLIRSGSFLNSITSCDFGSINH